MGWFIVKLTKRDAVLHQQACDLLGRSARLTVEEQEFVLRHWQESQNSTAVTTLAGAFFTPLDLAKDVALHASGARRVIDLGAGIGALAWAARRKMVAGYLTPPPVEIVCVERNPEYVAVGRRVLPEAEWICADLFGLPAEFRDGFDLAISNPPFGHTPRSGRGPRYTGRYGEYHVLDVAADLAGRGVFLIPQKSAPFAYSGVVDRRWDRSGEYLRFARQTGIELEFNCGIDTSTYGGWRGVRPSVEVVTCDFTERHPPTHQRQQPPEPHGQLALLAA